MAAVEQHDLEGIVAKRKSDPYRRGVHWCKIKNLAYTQTNDGRGEVLNGNGRAARRRGTSLAMAKLLTVAAAALALTSCRTPPRQMNDADLCSMYGSAGLAGTPTAKYRAEIDRRGLISDWSHVDAHEIGPGMNECEALAVSGATDVSRTVTPQGEVKVYRFRRGDSLWTIAVNNGRVGNVIPPGPESDGVKGPDSRYR